MLSTKGHPSPKHLLSYSSPLFATSYLKASPSLGILVGPNENTVLLPDHRFPAVVNLQTSEKLMEAERFLQWES